MSNPTELPDLAEAVRKLVNAKGRFHTAQNYAEVVEALAQYDARRAQPEGEAPQADWQTYAPNLRALLERGYKSLASAAMAQTRDGEAAWYAMGEALKVSAPAATLSPLCGAQHAESGKEASSDWEMGLEDADGNPLATVRQDELSAAADFIASAALASVRIDGKDFRREDFVAFLKSRRGQSALAAQQAAAQRYQ